MDFNKKFNILNQLTFDSLITLYEFEYSGQSRMYMVDFDSIFDQIDDKDKYKLVGYAQDKIDKRERPRFWEYVLTDLTKRGFVEEEDDVDSDVNKMNNKSDNDINITSDSEEFDSEDIEMREINKQKEKNAKTLEYDFEKIDNQTYYHSDKKTINEMIQSISNLNKANNLKTDFENKRDTYNNFNEDVTQFIKDDAIDIDNEKIKIIRNGIQERVTFYTDMITKITQRIDEIVSEKDKLAEISLENEKVRKKIAEINKKIVKLDPYGASFDVVEENLSKYTIDTLRNIVTNSTNALIDINNSMKLLDFYSGDKYDNDILTQREIVRQNAEKMYNEVINIKTESERLIQEKIIKMNETARKLEEIKEQKRVGTNISSWLISTQNLRKAKKPTNIQEAREIMTKAIATWKELEKEIAIARKFTDNRELQRNINELELEYKGYDNYPSIIDYLNKIINDLEHKEKVNAAKIKSSSIVISGSNTKYVKKDYVLMDEEKLDVISLSSPEIGLTVIENKKPIHLQEDNSNEQQIYIPTIEEINASINQNVNSLLPPPSSPQITYNNPSMEEEPPKQQNGPNICTTDPDVIIIPDSTGNIKGTNMKITEIDDKPKITINSISPSINEKREEITKPKLPEERRRKNIKDISEDEITEGVIYRILQPKFEFEHLYLDMIRKTFKSPRKTHDLLEKKFNESIQKVLKEEVSLPVEQLNFLDSLRNWFLNTPTKFDPVTQKVYGMIYNYLIDLFGN